MTYIFESSKDTDQKDQLTRGRLRSSGPSTTFNFRVILCT